MGGSLGFLLGLSVLGLIGLLEKIFVLLITKLFCPKKRTEEVQSENDDHNNSHSENSKALEDPRSDAISETTLELPLPEKRHFQTPRMSDHM